MEISTKYNLGDTVWFMETNRPQAGKVYGIKIFTGANDSKVVYEVSIGVAKNRVLGESELYSNPKELVDHIAELAGL